MSVTVNKVVVASSESDSAAVDAVVGHHAELAGALAVRVQSLVDAAEQGDAARTARTRDALVGWCETELLPHARAEEQTMYPAAHAEPAGRLLVDAMLGEHEVIGDLVAELREADSSVRSAAAAWALRAVFESHLTKENDLVLPLLAESSRVSLADMLHGMHEILGEPAGEAEDRDVGGCGCNEAHDPTALPELDARAVPHAIRHATIFGALDAVQPGGGMVLVAPHDPLPLLAQLEERSPGAFEVSYLERGPETWRLAFRR
jgi:uncharacterized protein (DUF2249 family)/iron-sulfur cluster repair protein YtfE (RIC family)